MVGNLSVGSQLQAVIVGRLRKSGVRTSVIDYMLFGNAIEVVEVVVEDSGKFDVGLDR